MRGILKTTVKPQDLVKLGSLLAEIGHKVKLTDEEFALFESSRDKTPARAASFEDLARHERQSNQDPSS